MTPHFSEKNSFFALDHKELDTMLLVWQYNPKMRTSGGKEEQARLSLGLKHTKPYLYSCILYNKDSRDTKENPHWV